MVTKEFAVKMINWRAERDEGLGLPFTHVACDDSSDSKNIRVDKLERSGREGGRLNTGDE